MSEFKENKEIERVLKDVVGHGHGFAMVSIEAGQQHQQAKVDELQKQLSEYIFVAETLDEMYVKEVQKSDDLQKRVDKAIRLLVEAELYQSEPNIDLAVKALKGEG